MDRIPEPELMDDPEHVRAYHEADFSEPHNAFVEHFRRRFPDFRSGRVLDLGCGTCDVIIRFARVFPETCITGVDGSDVMLDIALKDLKRAGLSERIALIKAYLPYDNFSNKRFDAVISNTLLHHLVDPRVLWMTIKGYAMDGAAVFVVDLLRPDNRREAEELVRLHAGDGSPMLQRDFLNSLMASYTVDEVEGQLKDEGMDYMNVEVISDRHVAIWGRFRL